MCLTCNHQSVYLVWEDKESIMSTSQFPTTGPRLGDVRVVTLNLWGRNGTWADRRSVLIDGFRALRPDLVALQEVIKNDEYDQMIDLLGPGFHIAHQKGRDPEGMGISIASCWPLGEVRELDLHVTPRTVDFPCTTLVAEVFAPDSVGPPTQERIISCNHLSRRGLRARPCWSA